MNGDDRIKVMAAVNLRVADCDEFGARTVDAVTVNAVIQRAVLRLQAAADRMEEIARNLSLMKRSVRLIDKLHIIGSYFVLSHGINP